MIRSAIIPLRQLAFAWILWMSPWSLFAQAWTMPAGEAYVKLFYGEVKAGHQFTFDGRSADFISGLPGDTYRDRSLYAYAEMGLADRLSLILSFPYKRTFVRDHAFRFRLYSPGTASLGVRYSLDKLLGVDKNKHAVAVNIQAFVPTGYVRNYTPSSGGGQVDVQGMVFYGKSFYPLPAYLQIGTGFRYRSSIYAFSKAIECIPGSDIHCTRDTQPKYNDEWLFHAEIGASPLGDFLLLQILSLGTLSTKNPEVGFSPLNPIPTSQRYLKIGGGVAIYPFSFLNVFALSSLGFNLQYFETPVGRNTINSRDMFMGFEFRASLFNN
ncbi:MAG: hypothetical protein KTR29_24255 [Rhodothermaceae bacterium]|nr:hypothetical protein [Rhodothermaceae bacterium]